MSLEPSIYGQPSYLTKVFIDNKVIIPSTDDCMKMEDFSIETIKVILYTFAPPYNTPKQVSLTLPNEVFMFVVLTSIGTIQIMGMTSMSSMCSVDIYGCVHLDSYIQKLWMHRGRAV